MGAHDTTCIRDCERACQRRKTARWWVPLALRIAADPAEGTLTVLQCVAACVSLVVVAISRAGVAVGIGLVWDRRGGWVAPTADDFFTRQIDAWVDADGGWDPDGGLDDDYDDALAASWGDEAWDDADVY